MTSNVYVSYSWWADEDSRIIDKLKAAWKVRGIDFLELKVDKQQINYGDSIRAFMDELTESEHVILVLSDAYFKSPNCMYELRGIYDKPGFRKRVSPIVLKGTNLYDPVAWVLYLRHWEQKEAELDAALKTIKGTNAEPIYKSLNDYADFRRLLAKQLEILSDMNALTPDIHIDTDFEALLDRIRPPSASKPSTKPGRHRKPDAEFQPAILGHIKKVLETHDGLRVELSSKSTEVLGPGDPLENLCNAEPTQAIQEVLRPATEQCLSGLSVNSDGYNKTWEAAKSILGWLSLFSVNPGWIEQHEKNPDLSEFGFDMAVKTRFGVEIVSSRYQQMSPNFHAEPGKSHVYGEDAITHNLETGWGDDKALSGLLLEIWAKVIPYDTRRELSEDDVDLLNSTIVSRDKFKENHYYIPFGAGDACPLNRKDFCKKVLDKLPAITLIRLVTSDGQATLQVDNEIYFMTAIREFLTIPYRH
ncbi:MAG: hypothetical protein DM484_05715 [Candidatus Methylumidiphilus alinenensis]|uniref:TIR domain-containing protein n=1 Tax=Candidatus Methylumidiphilus alinenensis TaxID=2202197 RepID=A0A2W4RJT1_9GAMM|nr:MAG: hypothetical protein DM484_05715 [Candidatus Methylumidiphilus alinenensis]